MAVLSKNGVRLVAFLTEIDFNTYLHTIHITYEYDLTKLERFFIQYSDFEELECQNHDLSISKRSKNKFCNVYIITLSNSYKLCLCFELS